MPNEDEFEDRPRRSRRDDEFENEPRRPRRDGEDDRPARPAKKSNLFLILGIVAAVLIVPCCGGGFYMLLNGVQSVRTAANRMKLSNNFKQVGLGVSNYESTYAYLPTNTYDANGKPLLSWRVHILPYIEQNNLYSQFKLDEPWDSPNNRPLLDLMPAIYGRVGDSSPSVRGNRTYVRAFATPGAVMERIPPERYMRRGNLQPRPAYGLDEISDGASNTIFCIEAGESVEWTKPDDLTWDIGQPLPALGGDRGTNEFIVVLSDGFVRPFKKSIAPEQLKALITISGGEKVNVEDLIKK
ncbi:DUF1559 family PulG-like putative transporter [Zavarzinella formosa]|uniref:DUF1559 family PulG-like putative transporter n=1 Tax=Zavarzinella formosa TaxID=360055 RepID=UPI000361988F|nr:DUF1559 domain-containing protein [Zavarzinella formosa]